MKTAPYVLVVEDDQWMAEQYLRILVAEGMQAASVAHASAAMESIDQRQPDVLLVDVMLPGQNIFTLLHELQSQADLAGIPVLLSTNAAESLVAEDLRMYGIRCVLDKTKVQPQDIVAAVKRVLL